VLRCALVVPELGQRGQALGVQKPGLTNDVWVQTGLLAFPSQLLPGLLSFLVELYVSFLRVAALLGAYIVTMGC